MMEKISVKIEVIINTVMKHKSYGYSKSRTILEMDVNIIIVLGVKVKVN